jgi:hypothetical protein
MIFCVKKYSLRSLLGMLVLFGGPSILLAQQTGYKQTNLVANVAGVAKHRCSTLKPLGGIFCQ